MYGFEFKGWKWLLGALVVAGWAAIEGLLWVVRHLPISLVWG